MVTRLNLRLQYLQKRPDKLLYRRRIPSDLKKVFNNKSVYYKQLQCKVNAPEEDIVKAWSEIDDVFRTMIDTARNNFDEEIAQERLALEAKKWLQAHKISPGALNEVANVYHHQPWNIHSTAFEVIEKRYIDSIKYSEKNPHFNDFDLVNPPTPKEAIVSKAWELAIANLTKRKKKRLISECWDIYVSNRVDGYIDKTTREGKRIYASWNRFLSYIKGNCLIEDTETIYDALDRMINDREKTVSNASIERDWIVISAVLNSVIKVERLNLKFHKPLIKTHTPAIRPVFSQSDQISLVHDIVNDQFPTERGVVVLLSLQAGLINSELQRLEKKNVRLYEEIPHIVITGKTKTKDRKRTVPITVGIHWLRKAFRELDDGSQWAMGESFATAKDSTVSKRIVLSLKKYRERDNKNYSCYSFRHCFKANAISHNASERYLYIAGWRNKETAISDTYAKDAMTQISVLQGIEDTSKTVNKHLLKIDCPTSK